MTATPTRRRPAGAAIRWTLALAQFLLILDTAVLNVAVPRIAESVHIAPAQQSWVINAFVIPFAGLLLAAGYLADQIGRRRAMIGGLILLAGGALLGVFAVDAATVLASRAIQGVGGAVTGASAMSLVLHLFTGDARARALALYATMAGAGGVAGTVAGGALTDWLGWRSLFALNVAAALALAATAAAVLPGDPTHTPTATATEGPGRRMSAGPVAMTVALAAAAYTITAAAQHPVASPHVWGAAAIAAAAALLFVGLERLASTPVIPRAVWSNRPMLTALALAGVSQFTLTPIFLLVSVYPQENLGYSAFAAGVILLPMSVAIVFIAPLLPRLLGVVGLATVLVAGFAAIAVGAGALAFLIGPGRSYLAITLVPTLIIAFGVPSTAMTTNIATAAHAGTAPTGITGGLLTTAQQFGAALGLAALPAIAQHSGGYRAAFVVACGAAVIAIAAAVVSVRRRSI
ncbi:MFS transporter [Tsukamurella tyrosinosolvens]|uniref:MFS transporter n=1 Tax=Tsukamurella tyrosinosolvens TaxID=57704 RepID=UPI00079934A1|nr:MFS transporter [Tsukamurella tyrosinosolvens]KXP04852.1 hypothetical protein AXK59_15920 [Tsukamurella tyrosinosolvens]